MEVTRRDKRLSAIKLADSFINKQLYSIDDELQALVFDQDHMNSGNHDTTLLKNAYNAAKLRSTEFMNINVPMNLRLHSQQASRVYNSIAALVFAHLAIAKSEQIEKYIKIKGSQLPSNVLDLKDWQDVLNLAKDFRESSSIPHKGLFEVHQSTDLRLWVAIQVAKKAQQDLAEAKKEMKSNIDKIQNEMNTFVSKMTPAIASYEKVISAKARALQKENDGFKEVIARHDSDTCVLKLQNEGLEEDLSVANQSIEKLQSEIQALVDMANQRNAEIAHLKKALISPQENARMMESLLAAVEDCHLQTIASLSQSASLSDYHAAIKERNAAKVSSEGIILPTAADIATRCAILDQAYDQHITGIVTAKDQLINQINQDFAKLDDDYRKFAEATAAKDTAYEQEKSQMSAKHSQLESMLASMTTLLKSTEDQLNQSKASNEELTAKLSHSEKENKLLESKIYEQVIELKVAKDKHQEDVTALETYVANLRKLNEDQSNKLTELQDTTSSMEIKLKSTEEQYHQSNKMNTELSSKLNSSDQRIAVLEAKVKDNDIEIQDLHSKHKEDMAALEFYVSSLQKTNQEHVIQLTNCDLKIAELEAKLQEMMTINQAPVRASAVEVAEKIVSSAINLAMSKIDLDRLTGPRRDSIPHTPVSSLQPLVHASDNNMMPSRSLNEFSELSDDAAFNNLLSNRSSIINAAKQAYTNIDLSMMQDKEVSIVKLQARVRGFLDRSHVRDILLQQAAREKGILVAYPGTKQGDAGWYIDGESLYYFCFDHGQFNLLCGPIAENIFQLAIRELEHQAANTTGASLTSIYDKDIAIDRVATQVIKMQMEALSNEINHREQELQILRDAQDESSSEEQVESIRQGFLEQIQYLEKQLQKYKDLIEPQSQPQPESSSSLDKAEEKNIETAFKADLHEESGSVSIAVNTTPSKLLVQPLVIQIANNNHLGVLGDKRNSSNYQLVSSQAFFSDSPTAGIVIDEHALGSVIKVQAITRGFLTRHKVTSEIVQSCANEAGVLVALRNTVQGESGWYTSPEGIYYFVLDGDNWIMAAGPINTFDYERTRNTIKAVARQTSMSHLTRMSSRLSTGAGGSTSIHPHSEQHYLVHCPFNLSIEHETIKGEIFMSNQTERLFIAVSVDDLITSSQLSIHEHDSSSHAASKVPLDEKASA
jgi:hypothetical protein